MPPLQGTSTETSLPPSFFDALDLVVRDFAEESQKNNVRARQRVQESLDALSAKESKLMDTFLSGVGINEETFTRHLRAIEDERISLQEEMGILLVDHIDFDAVIQKARQIMGDLRTSWNTLGPNERKVFLRFLVPDGIGFENGSVRTPLSIDGIRGIASLVGDEKRLARPTGFEPVLPP